MNNYSLSWLSLIRRSLKIHKGSDRWSLSNCKTILDDFKKQYTRSLTCDLSLLFYGTAFTLVTKYLSVQFFVTEHGVFRWV